MEHPGPRWAQGRAPPPPAPTASPTEHTVTRPPPTTSTVSITGPPTPTVWEALEAPPRAPAGRALPRASTDLHTTGATPAGQATLTGEKRRDGKLGAINQGEGTGVGGFMF